MEIDRLDLGKAVADNDFDKNVSKSFQRLMDQLIQVLNHGLIFEDNFVSFIGEATTSGTPDTETAIAHDLKAVPAGYIVLSRDQAGIVYDSGKAWTTENIYVKSNVASLKIKILIF